MKKLKNIFKVILFIVPIVFVFVIFIMFEPYNYFGIHSGNGDVTSAITVMRRFLNGDYENIILGNSKLAELNSEDLVTAGITEERWCNMALNGASIEEQCDLFWFAVENGNIKKVVFTESFWYTRKGAWHHSRILQEKNLVEPRAYIINPNSYIAAFEKLGSQIKDPIKELKRSEAIAPVIDIEERKDYYTDYVNRIWRNEDIKNYLLSYDMLAEIIDVIKYCNDNNIEFKMVTLPIRQEIYDLLEEYNILSDVSLYKRILANYTNVYDMEYPENKWTKDFLYADGVHFYGMEQIGLPGFKECYPMLYDALSLMFDGTATDYKLWDNTLTTSEIFYSEKAELEGNGETVIWSGKVKLEEDCFYQVSFDGKIPQDAELFYMDFFYAGRSDVGVPAFIPAQLDYAEEGWSIVSTKNVLEDQEAYFRIVYIGKEDIKFENVRVEKIN